MSRKAEHFQIKRNCTHNFRFLTPSLINDYVTCILPQKERFSLKKKLFSEKKSSQKNHSTPPTPNSQTYYWSRAMLKVLIITILCQGCENKVFAIISKKAVVSYYYYILHNYHCTKKTHFYGCDYVSKSNKKAILIRNLLFCTHFKNTIFW